MSFTIKRTALLLVSAGFFSLPPSLSAVETDPVGYITITVPANSDAVVSPVLKRASIYKGTIASITDSDTIVVSGNPNFTTDQFAPDDVGGRNSNYVLLTSGNREGLWAVIVSNSADSLNLNFVNQDLGSTVNDMVLAGDEIEIVPFWTSRTLFPDAEVDNLSQLLLFSRTVPGINIASGYIYVCYDGYGWYYGGTDANDLPIYPDESFIFRNRSESPQTLTQAGSVPMANFRTVIALITDGVTQDIRLTSGLPVDVALQDLFGPSGGAADGDKLLFFDNASTGQNKASSMIATYYDGFGWYYGGTEVNTSFQIKPGEGFIYRRNGANTGDVVVNFKASFQ